MLNAVTVKLPELWTNQVRSWFTQVEAQFATKYFYVIQALSQRTIHRIPDLLILPVEDSYQALKVKLVEMYNMSNYQQAELLMVLPPAAGDVRPSR